MHQANGTDLPGSQYRDRARRHRRLAPRQPLGQPRQHESDCRSRNEPEQEADRREQPQLLCELCVLFVEPHRATSFPPFVSSPPCVAGLPSRRNFPNSHPTANNPVAAMKRTNQPITMPPDLPIP